MTPVKNIIFDYGGVILNIDHQKPIDAFRSAGLHDFDKLYSHALQTDLFDRLEKGEIEPDFFYQQIRDISGLNLPDMDIENAWNAIILDMPEHRIRLLQKLKKVYHVFLLSNTNVIHHRVYSQLLKEVYGYCFEDLFEKAYFSFQLGLKKPDLEIFRKVLDDNSLAAGETLFIDDSPRHIAGAEKAGINAFLLKDKRDIVSMFDPLTLEITL